MAFNGSLISPMPLLSGAFNDVNGKLIAPMPILSGSFNSLFTGAIVAPFPVLNGIANDAFSGKLVAPMPIASGSFVSVTLFFGSLISPMPVMKGSLGYIWGGKLVAPMPVILGIFVGSSYPFDGKLVAPMPVMNGLIGIYVSSTYTVMVMNLKNKLVSFYQNYNFESVGMFNGVPIGCDPATGLYVLSGPDDNGTEIDASILLGNYDFGENNEKTVPRLYLNYSGDGEAQVSVSTDQDEMDGPYDIPAPHETKLQTRRARLPIGFRGSHYQYLIENVQGSHLNIQNIELQFKKSQRRLH